MCSDFRVLLSAWLCHMLMRPNKAETAVHGSHCLGHTAVDMHKVLAKPCSGVV